MDIQAGIPVLVSGNFSGRLHDGLGNYIELTEGEFFILLKHKTPNNS